MSDQAPIGIGIRRCSPVFGPDGAGTVGEVDRHVFWVVDAYEAKDLRLDLQDPTGFMHGVWAVASAFWGDVATENIGFYANVEDSSWTLMKGDHDDSVRFEPYGGTSLMVPALRNIQSDQPQQALAAIMRHVFEVTP